MFSKSNQNILFSKVYSTLNFRKQALSPISGYGPEAILNLVSGWYKMAKITSEPNQPDHRTIVHVTLGYYSIYPDYIGLYNNILYLKDNIALDVIESSGYILTDREKLQYAILVDLLALLPEQFDKKTISHQSV